MKPFSILKTALLIVISALFFASCAPARSTSTRSSVPDHCRFENQHNRSNPKKVTRKPEAPPYRTTPIGGNYRVRS
ncbi:MAG: hypothetical protein LBH22_08295 [Bacteroidales bacterium]|nr:hypothetical protein [Bacteroidales bacterium]